MKTFVEEFVAKVQIPPDISCPTDKCPGSAARCHCKNKTCFWYICDICDHTTWLSPRVKKGTLGTRITTWTIASQQRVHR